MTNFTQRPVWHWWAQRLTAVCIIPFILWAINGLLHTEGIPANVRIWLKDPLVTAVSIGLSSFILYHAQLGIRVIIEDYISSACCQKALLVLNTSAMVLGIGIVLVCFYTLHLV